MNLDEPTAPRGQDAEVPAGAAPAGSRPPLGAKPSAEVTGRAKPAPGERIQTLAEADAVQESLYAKRIKIYPREVHGRFARLRVLFVALTLGGFYGLPWVNWGAGRQAFLIDLPARQFNLFFWTFYPQDLFYLTTILIISALSLFLFTAVAGRLWCGFTCPQTVWTEMFLWIERKIEGDRMKQMKLAKSPWTGEKIAKRAAKHFVWITFALWTGYTFVGFFTPIRELTAEVMTFSLSGWEMFWIFFYGLATYGNAGFLREQVCLYMCPYARFQSVMFDPDTRIISYDAKRGEPRGSRSRNADPKTQGLGACVDCTLCVQVCPTGIDIRNGLQYACISCAACVDVCDSVMDKMGYPKGLIRFTTEHELAGQPSRLLRPRVAIYSAILGVIALALVAAVLLRVPLDLEIIRDRNSLYRETPEGLIENVYSLKILNMDNVMQTYRVSVSGIEGLQLRTDDHDMRVGPGQTIEVPVRVQIDSMNLQSASQKISFELQSLENPKIVERETAAFLAPPPER